MRLKIGLAFFLQFTMSSLLPAAVANAESVTATYLYSLSDFNGVMPYSGARTFADEARGEVYVVAGGGVDIFNSSGMLIYHFDYDRELGGVYDAAVDEQGRILLLSHKENEYRIVQCNYRGEPQRSFPLRNLPPEFEAFRPGRMVYRAGEVYLADQGGMYVAILDPEGRFLRGYDIATLYQFNDRQRMENGIEGFMVDNNRNMLFVVGALGRAVIQSPDGTIKEYGKRGSGAGKFGVPGGIAEDRFGNILVTDKLRGVIMIFSKDFQFLREFGFRGTRPSNVIVPNEITVDTAAGRVYVSQMRRRGVNIYQLTYQ
ncbi:hypothetical protein KP003_14645 [Geomonas nitrogeniifigens]|uniref:hypothetical protein n=1 Tax=Geomonas diazotrophica TaxID=2843197 RepID=UPI001C2BBE50|nr:hypothetical protein [Geomonas nitrogeniifigens]QXE85615.1 hypothetical protein KP003_14645 [Geomonas nitrogeniifigens]